MLWNIIFLRNVRIFAAKEAGISSSEYNGTGVGPRESAGIQECEPPSNSNIRLARTLALPNSNSALDARI